MAYFGGGGDPLPIVKLNKHLTPESGFLTVQSDFGREPITQSG